VCLNLCSCLVFVAFKRGSVIFYPRTRFHLAIHGPTKCTHKIFIKISYSTFLKIKIAVDKVSIETAFYVCNQFLSPNYFKITVDHGLERIILWVHAECSCIVGVVDVLLKAMGSVEVDMGSQPKHLIM
jgi:hypothetical protein